MELRGQVSNTFLCDLQWNTNGIAIQQNDGRVTAILAHIDDYVSDRSPTGRTLEIGEEREEKEMGETK